MSLTVCTVNCKNWKYIYFQDYTYRRLADDKGFRRLICNVTPGNTEAELLSRLPNTTVFFHDSGDLRGSEAHGAALNELLPRIETEYAVFADPDTAALMPGWDTTCRVALDERTVAIGTPYSPKATFRYQGFPHGVFLFFVVEPVRRLEPDFRPESDRRRALRRKLARYWPAIGKRDPDVGWRLPGLFKRVGYRGLCFDFLKCDDPRSVVLAPDARGDEFHWCGAPIITHQGRSGPRGFDQDPVSQLWLDKVCSYLDIDRRVVDEVVRV